MSRSQSVEFLFRVWVHPEDGDPPEIEVWYHGLEDLKPGTCFASEWARNSLNCEDFHDLFELSKDKHWQVVGKAVVRGSFDYYGEYDEELDVIEFVKSEVPESYYAEQEDTACMSWQSGKTGVDAGAFTEKR